MTLAEQKAKGNFFLAMAEALVAGRAAGHVEVFTEADNPYNKQELPDEFAAWNRGFWVGRSIDEPQLNVQVAPAPNR